MAERIVKSPYKSFEVFLYAESSDLVNKSRRRVGGGKNRFGTFVTISFYKTMKRTVSQGSSLTLCQSLNPPLKDPFSAPNPSKPQT